MDTDLAVILVAIVGMTMTTIGVLMAMFLRLDRRIDVLDSRITAIDTKIDGVYHKLDTKIDGVYDKLDTKIDGVFDKLDSKIDSLTSDVVDLKQRFSRIEGYLEARDGFTPATGDSPASAVAVE